jgi:1-aminocyclopropane-1-carboxylate deaminase/D-cysteine desulfhydrase-like pyridoxal-dependent ACC family enzyme
MDNYNNYINSLEWQAKAAQRKALDLYTCQTCGATERLEVHHKHYRTLGNESMDDLITLCRDCHEAITTSIRERKYRKNRKHINTQVERITPIIEGVNHELAEIELQDYGSVPTYHAQRATGKSNGPDCETDQSYQWQARQDGRRAD